MNSVKSAENASSAGDASLSRRSEAEDPLNERGKLRRLSGRAKASAAAAMGVLLVGSGYLLAGQPAGHHGHGSSVRQSEVAERGAQVMPFDLDKTTHVFREGSDGGRQTVRADDASDVNQVTLIRQHLREEQAAFARGDFSDPAKIHGEDMPGLAALRSGASRIKVAYSDLPDGAVLTYTTTDPALVEALHAWFRAQVSDHGSHAQSGSA